MSRDQGDGPENFYEPLPVTVTLCGTPVQLPAGAFLQATEDGEAALVSAVREAVGESQRSADLFAGLGTFALALPGQVYAAEASRDAVLALKRAAPNIAAEHRDLYRRPLDAAELANFDAVVLDPPRAGAAEQIAALAASPVPRIAYVSCNPATFARDARTLADGGYTLLRGIGDQSSVVTTAQSGGYQLNASLGQPFASSRQGGAMWMGRPYWYGGGGSLELPQHVYIPLIIR
jgi:23S rRNA (uracil1939-C5)-methyltransferase